MGKKNLNKLFQDKLQDFSEVPDEKVWQSIEASLNQKKKSRKVIPIWWKLGGVAAILLIAITLINPFNDSTVSTPTVTDTNSSSEKTPKEKSTEKTSENQNSNKNQIVDVEQKTNSNTKDASMNQVTANSNNTLKSNSVQKTTKQHSFKNKNTAAVLLINSDNIKAEKAFRKNATMDVESNYEKSNAQTTEVVESGTSKSELEKNLPEENSPTKDSRFLNEIDDSSKEGIAENKKEGVIEDIEESKKKSIFDEIAAQQEEDKTIVENTGSKWSAGPSVAPVYFDALGEGSPVHSIFVPNSKSGDLNLSYGLSVAYEVSKKLSIRSGVHKVDYGYRTNDVEFSSSFENATSSQIDNINYTATSRNLVVSSKVGTRVDLNQNPFLNTTSQDVSATSIARDGTLEQQFGYLEVPLELNYALVDERFGINLIGGVSSLFLVDNSVSLSSGELTTDVGEANNINSVNFSTNVGFGMNYKVTPNVRLNVEPVFKYQLNTFSETEGTFNPFSIGVYSGLSFQF